jgi:hypothetical protein
VKVSNFELEADLRVKNGDSEKSGKAPDMQSCMWLRGQDENVTVTRSESRIKTAAYEVIS